MNSKRKELMQPCPVVYQEDGNCNHNQWTSVKSFIEASKNDVRRIVYYVKYLVTDSVKLSLESQRCRKTI